MQIDEVLAHLGSMGRRENVEGMARFGINAQEALGIPIPSLRALAKRIGKDHSLALKLWVSGIHEARILAGFVDEPGQVTLEQADRWAYDFDSWDVCDQVCAGLFDRTPFAWELPARFAESEKEFVRRAGFVMMAALAVHDKEAPDKAFVDLFPLIERHADDGRNFVKKAVNWALRQIGKRNLGLNKKAITLSENLERRPEPSARWIAKDALRELRSPALAARLRSRGR